MYQWVKPHVAVPVHGEFRHMSAQAALARQCQTPHVIIPENGTVISLDQDAPAIIGTVPSGRLALDGRRIVSLDSEELRARRRISREGAVVASLVLDSRGQLSMDPMIAMLGVLEEDDEDAEEVRQVVVRAVEGLDAAARRRDARVSETVRLALRKRLNLLTGKKPAVTVHLARLQA